MVALPTLPPILNLPRLLTFPSFLFSSLPSASHPSTRPFVSYPRTPCPQVTIQSNWRIDADIPPPVMDYTSFYPSTAQQFANPLSATNPPFSLSQNGPTQVPANRSSRNIPQQNNPIAQLQQNMFYLDPFESKLGEASSNDMDHASYSSKFPYHLQSYFILLICSSSRTIC